MAYSVTFAQRLVNSIWERGTEMLQENAYDKHRAIDVLVNRGKGFKDANKAGTFIAIPANVRLMNISQQVTEGAEYNLINVETEQMAQYKWQTTMTPLIFTDEELGENQGRAQILDTVKTKMGVAKEDHIELIDQNLFTGSGTTPSTESLNTIVGNLDNGGLSVATYPKWISYVDSNAEHMSATLLEKSIDATLFGDSTQGLDFIFTGLTLFQRYKDISQGKTTIFQEAVSQKPDAGYTGVEIITFRGALWFWDRRCPDTLNNGAATNYVYGIDSSKIRMFVQKGRDMAIYPEKEAPFQMAKHIPIISRYNFCPLQRRGHFKLTNVDIN